MTIDANVSSLIDASQDFRDDLAAHSAGIKDIKDRMARLTRQINEINAKIGDSNVEQARFWESKRREWKAIKEEKIEELGKKQAEMGILEAQLKKIQGDLDEELQAKDKHKHLVTILNFYGAGLTAATGIKNDIMEDVRKEVQEKTNVEFHALIWKKEEYKDVTIDESYNVSVKHRSGIEGMGTLSAGERQVLALSFMAALNGVSGFDVPIIIDTPLGRLSKEPKKNIAMNLPNYLKGKQVTLLVTEEEYTPEVREKLASRVGKEYLIRFRETAEGNLAEVVPLGN
jgi:DNA sulfur modification protein DndD